MSIQPYSGTTSLKYILDETNKQINNITKLLSTGLKSDDTASSYLASNLNLDALDAANKAENAQNGLSFLQVAQKAYSDIVKELNTIANIANDVLNHNYTEDELQAKQDLITTSINKIKDIEANTKYGDINVFNNPNSAGSINQHMFAVTSQEITYTEETVDSSARGKDYSSYLANSVTRYTMSGLDTITGPSGETITLDENHIAIKTAEELVAALNTADTAGKTYYLMENIDLSSLGTLDDSLITETFQGTLEGNGYAISGLSIDSTNNRVGLFSTIGNGATIKNLVLKDFNIKGNEKVGALVGYTTAGNANTLDNISVINSTIQATTLQVGGIAGSLENSTTSLSNIIVQANVSAGTMFAGGIVGSSFQGNISNAAFSGNVTGESYLGGIAGLLDSPPGSIVQSYSMGTITQTKENTAAYTGGLVGHNRGIISNSYTTATISSATGATLVGALVGKNENTATIYNTYALGTGNGGEVALSTTQTGTVAGSTPTGMTEYTIDDITYAFASEDDKNAFVNQNGAVDSFYKFDTTTGSWIEMAQQFKNGSYQIESVTSSIADIPKDGFSYLSNDGKLAFSSQEDLDKYDASTNSFSGTVETYYEKIGDNWVEKTVNAIYSDLEVSTTGTTTSQPRPSDFYQYTVERDGYIYAFYNESMMNNFINNNSSALSGYRLDLNGDVDTEWVAFTTATGSGEVIQDRGKDYSAYLANSVDRYTKLNDTTIQAADGTTITLDDNHIAIYTAEEFVAALNVSDTAGKTYYLMENIDLSSLGTLDHALITETFQGTLEGNGYAISGLTIDAPESSSADNASLFNGIDNNAIIRNLILKDFNLNAYYAAALAGMVSGNAIIDNISIQNSNITASKGDAGGLVRHASSATFSNIIVNQTNISALNTSGTAGGILGTAWQTSISKVVFSGSVTGAYQAGGIIGAVTKGTTKGTTLSEAYSSGVITQTGRNSGSAGGLVGKTSTTDTVSNSYTDALVSGVDGAKVGALVGSNSGTLSDSYAINSTLAGVGNSNLTLGSASNTYVIRDDQSLDQTTYNIRYIGQDQVASGVLDFRDSTVWQNNENGKPTLLNAPSLSTLEISEEDLAELPGRVAQAGEIIDGIGIIYTKPNDTEASIYYGNYYFKTEEDKENFILYQQGLYIGRIEEFWKKTGANSWDVLTLSEQQVITSYSSSSTGNVITQSAAQGKPEYDVYYQDPTNITSPIYRFQTEEDRDAFIGFLSGNIPTSNISFLEKTSSGWQEKNLIVSGDEYETIVKANSVLTTPDGYNVAQGNITNSFEFDGDTYTILGGYAFKNGTLDRINFNNGSPTATIDKFFILQEDGSWQSASVNSVDGALTIQTTHQTSFDASITYKGQTYYFYNNSYDKAFLNKNDANKYNAEAGIFTGDVSSYIQIKDDGSFEEMRVTGQQTAEQDIIRQSTNESVSSVMYDYVSYADQANDTNRRYYTTVAKYISPGSNSERIIAITEDSAGKYIIDEDGFVQINPGETISIRFWDENTRSWGIAGTTGASHGTASGIGLTIIPANLGDEYTQDITWNGFQIKAEEGLTFDENGPTQVGKSFYILENDGVTWTKYTSAYRMEYTPEKVADISNSISVPNSSYQKTTIDGKTYAFKSSEMISSLDNLSSVSNFYMLNEATMQWDFYTVSTSTSASSFEIVDGTDTVAASAVTTTGSMYAFASEEDRQAFNNGTLAGSSKYYEYDSVNQNWKEYTVSQVSYSGLAFAGENNGIISTSFLVTGEASRNETIDGVTLLGDEQLANGLLGFNEPTIWQNNPNGLPTLITAPNTDKFNISDSSLGNLGSTTTFKENISYTTENIRFQGALTHDSFTFTTTADDKTLTLSELENKYISNIRIGSEGKVYTEGTDYIIYAEKSGDNITWKIDLMSDDIKGKELTFEYDYAHKDATQSTTGGFDIFLGENHKINISSLVLDLAGRLNFNVTSKDNAAATLTAIEGLRDYLDLKEWSLEADMSLVANALTNKNTQNSILNLAFNSIMSIDEALLKAELAAAELKRDTIQEFMSYFEKFNASTVTSLLYDPNSTQQTGDFTNLLLGRQSTGDENMDLLSSLVSSGAFNNSNNNEIMKLLSTYNNSNGYFYSNLYDYIQEKYKLA